MGYIKVDEALPEFRERFGEVIQMLSAGVKTRTFGWMERQLENSYPSQGHAMMTLLTEYGFAGNLDIDYTHCGRIESFDLRYFEEKKQGIKSACDSIAHLMSDSHIAEKKQNLGESISHIVFGNIKGMVKSDIISPIANFVGGYVGGLASGLVSEHFNTQKQQLKEFRQYLEQLIPTPNMEITFNPKNYEPDTLFEPFKNIQENTYIEIDNPHESENQEPTEKIKIIFIPKSKAEEVKKYSKTADNRNVEDVYATPNSVEERISQGFDNKKQAVLDNIYEGLKKINHQNDYMVIKWLNQFYVVEKGMVQGLMFMGEAEFATHYPNLYETIEDKFDKAGEYVGDKIHKLDKTLTRLGGKDYTDFKHNVGDFLTTVNKNAPEFVRDGLALIALGGPIVKGTGFVIDKVGDVFDKIKLNTKHPVPALDHHHDVHKDIEALESKENLLNNKIEDYYSTINNDVFNGKIEWGKQGKHIRGHKNFLEGRSELIYEKPEKLFQEFGGKGTPANTVERGFPGFKERFDAKEIIGIYVDIQGNKIPTNKGMIIYSKDGIHIYPVKP